MSLKRVLEPSARAFDASLRAALSLEEVRELLGALGVPGERARKTSDRHWTVAYRRTA